MTSRLFDGNTGVVVCSMGNAPQVSANMSVFVCWKPASVSAQGLVFVSDGPGGAGNPRWNVNPFSDGKLYLGGNGFSALSSYTAGDGWRIDAVSIGTPPAAPRYARYLFDTNSWSPHTDGSAMDAFAPGTSLSVQLGRQGGGAEYLNGRIYAVATYTRVLTDAEKESSSLGIAQWTNLSPSWFVIFNQDPVADLTDLSGGGSTEITRTDTSASSDTPPFPSRTFRQRSSYPLMRRYRARFSV